MPEMLTDKQREELDLCNRAFGPWERSDADDPEIVEAIMIDLDAHADVEWLTAELVVAYLRTLTE